MKENKICILKLIVLLAIVSSVRSDTKGSLSSDKCRTFYGSDQRGFTPPTGSAEEFASQNEFPFMAAIGREDDLGTTNYLCGGVLISPNYVLAPAHCALLTHGVEANAILLGELDLREANQSRAKIEIKRNIIHPDYKKLESHNDIALIELMHSVLNRPVCLWTNDEIEETHPTLIFYDSKDRSNLSKLRKAKIQITSKEECDKYYKTRLETGLLDSQICAKEVNPDDCQITASGPLLIQGKQTEKVAPHVIALSSLGLTCSDEIMPSVYTRISSYIEWIESVVWSESD